MELWTPNRVMEEEEMVSYNQVKYCYGGREAKGGIKDGGYRNTSPMEVELLFPFKKCTKKLNYSPKKNLELD